MALTRRTYTTNMKGVGSRPIQDVVAALSYMPVDGVEDDGGWLEIIDVKALPRPGEYANTSASQPGIRLMRVTAHVGGLARQATARAFDTNSAALPSQIEARRNPDRVTAGVTLRGDQRVIHLMNLPAGTGGGMAARITSTPTLNAALGEMFGRAHVADLEPLVLRAGEGVAVLASAPGLTFGYIATVEIIFRIVATGATWVLRDQHCYSPDEEGGPIFSFINGAGSGVVLEVAEIQFYFESANPDVTLAGALSQRQFRLKYIDGADNWSNDPESNETEIIVAMDSANAVPSGVTAQRGPFLNRGIATKYRMLYDWATTGVFTVNVNVQHWLGDVRRCQMPSFTTRLAAAQALGSSAHSSLYSPDNPWILRRGSMFCLASIDLPNNHIGAVHNVYDVQITFNHVAPAPAPPPPPPPPGGGGIRVAGHGGLAA